MSNRIIKFRAFIEIEGLKLMIDDVVVYPSNKLLGCDSDSFDEALPEGWRYDNINNFITGPDGKEIELDAIDVFNHEGEWVFFEGAPMQFTGVKDKNGVDVYDGDVIRYTLMAGLGMPERKGLTRIVKTDHLGSIGWYDTDITVLGNRYENPELLTQFELS